MVADCPKAVNYIFAVVLLLNVSADAWISPFRYHSQCVLHQQLLRSFPFSRVSATLSSDETSAPERRNAQDPLNSPRKATLYDILGVPPNATRTELKQQYVALAKRTHPDAQRTASSSSEDSSEYDFTEIAMAYKVLSNSKERLRYDRSIQAEIFTEQIASAVQNHPITELTIKAIGTIAIPLFRTMNKVSAAPSNTTTEEVNRRSNEPKTNSNSFPRKSLTELEREAEKEYNALLEVRQNLQSIMLQRLRVSLHTPQSGLTSNEAILLLDSFQQNVDTFTEDESGKSKSSTTNGRGISWVERLNFLRSSVEAEISALQNSEMAFVQQQQVNSQAQQVHQTAIQDLVAIRRSLIDAEREESEARRMLEEAMDNMRRQRNHYERINGQLFAAEHAAALASNELERLQNIIVKQSESVRHSLIRKERALLNDSHNGPSTPPEQKSPPTIWDKPDPPMSPLVYSSPSRRPRTLLAKSAFSSQLLHSSESSMLGPWPKQSFTLSQSQHEAMSEEGDLFLEDVTDEEFPSHTPDRMDAPMFVEGPKVDPSIQDHERNSIELAKLRQQEQDLIVAANTIEARLSHLMDQVKQLQ